MQKNQNTKGFSASMLLTAVRRRKLLVVVPAILLSIGFTLFALRMPERYRSQALVAVEPAAAQDYVKNRSGAPTINVQDQMRAIRETLFSQPVLEQVVKEFRLTERADPEDPSWLNGIERLIGGFKLYAQSKELPAERAIEDLKSRLAIQVEGPDAFYIAYQGESRQQVVDLTNRVAELFTKRASAIRDQRAEEAAGFMDAEVERLRRKLAAQDEQIRQYKQRAVHEIPENLATNMRQYEIVQDQISARSEKIAAEQARRAAALEEIRELEKQGVHQATEPREKTASEARLEDLRIRYREMQARYTPNHPEVVRLDREIKDLEKSVTRTGGRKSGDPGPAYMRYLELKGELQAIDQRLRSYNQDQRAQFTDRDLYRKRVESAPAHERVIAQLVRDEEVTRAQYAALVEKQNEARLDQRLDKMNKGLVFKVVEPARLPEAPFTPHREKILLAGVLASLLFGVVLAVVVEQLDTSFDNIDEFQGFTNLPVLTVVPSIPRQPESKTAPRGPITIIPGKAGPDHPGAQLSRDQLSKNRIVTLSDPGSIAAEQYGILALKVRQKLESPGKMVVVTSPAGGEGKTLTATNLSLALSSTTEGRVLLIDADMRRPRVHEYLGVKPSQGFGEMLQHIDDDPLKYTAKVRDLYVMSGGGKLSNPIGNLASRRARDLFNQLRQQFAFIVLDSPPILPLADSLVLAGLADGVVLVVRARQTRRELLQRAVESFDTSNVLGVVLNDVDYEHSPYTYAYKYYQKHYLGRQ